MAVIRASYIMECAGHGARETWFFQQGSESLDTAYQTWLTTLESRRLLVGKQGQVKALELSIELNNAQEPVIGDSTISYVYRDGFQSEDMADPNLCLLLKAQNGNRTKRRNQYLRLIWDSIEIEGGRYITPQNSTWQTKLAAWKAKMLAIPVGYLTGTRSTQIPLTSYTQNANGTVGLVFSAPTFQVGLIGKRVRLRMFTARTKSQLTGIQVVVPTSTTAAVTVARIAVLDQPVTGWTGSTYSYTFETTPFLDDQKIAEHLIGRPLLVSRGRRPTRARI